MIIPCKQYSLGYTNRNFASHPTDMTQGQWNTVLETNALLHASYVRLLRKGTVCKVERAMYPAFQLRSRLFLDFNASKDDKDIVIPAVCILFPQVSSMGKERTNGF